MGKKLSGDGAIAILGRAPNAIVVLDKQFNCTYANTAAEALTGVNTSEIIGRSIWETFPALQGSVFETQVTRAMADRKQIPFDFHYAPTARWCYVEAVPLDEGLVLYLADFTERRRPLETDHMAQLGAGMATQAPPSPVAGKTVLLVDDDESIRRVTRRILTNSGFRVLEAQHGADALRIAAEHNGEIDLLVTDVLMPGIRGPELVEGLAVTSPQLRVLYMSGYSDDDISRWGLQPGSAFIHKPFTSEGLADAVNAVLSTTRQG